jgi:hypothetical protein
MAHFHELWITFGNDLMDTNFLNPAMITWGTVEILDMEGAQIF